MHVHNLEYNHAVCHNDEKLQYENTRTDGISSFGCLSGREEGTKAKAVLSTDTEQVLFASYQVWNNQRLRGTGWVYLEKQNIDQAYA